MVVTPADSVDAYQEQARIALPHELHAAVVHVIVEPDDARDHGLAGEIDRARTGGHLHRARRPDGRDLLATNDDGLSILDRCAGAVHDTSVRQGDHGLVHGDVRLERGSELTPLRPKRRGEEAYANESKDATHVS